MRGVEESLSSEEVVFVSGQCVEECKVWRILTKVIFQDLIDKEQVM